MTLSGERAGHRWRESLSEHIASVEGPRGEDPDDDCQMILPDGTLMPLWKYTQSDEARQNRELWALSNGTMVGTSNFLLNFLLVVTLCCCDTINETASDTVIDTMSDTASDTVIDTMSDTASDTMSAIYLCQFASRFASFPATP